MEKPAIPLRYSPLQEMSKPLLELRYCVDQTAPAVSLHVHDFYEFYVFVCGDLDRYVIGQKNYKLEPGDILVIPPMVQHHPVFTRGGGQPYVRYFFWVQKAYLDSLRTSADADYFLRCCFEQDESLIHPPELQRRRILRTLEIAWDEITVQQICNDLYLQSHCLRFIADVNNIILSAGGQLRNTGNRLGDRMGRILAYIHDNYDKDLTLLSTAAHFGVSVSTIENLFNRTIGKPFYSYVTEYRITTAKALILDGLPLSEVSLRCGFSDYSNFFKVFTKRAGCSPSAFGAADHPPEAGRDF